MKKKLKRFGILIAAHIVGVIFGTFSSGLINDISIILFTEDYFGALLFAPFAMTICIPYVFSYYSDFIGCVIICGLIATIICFVCGIIKDSFWFVVGVFIASILWSLINLPIFHATMQV